jgi:hypothetical protein
MSSSSPCRRTRGESILSTMICATAVLDTLKAVVGDSRCCDPHRCRTTFLAGCSTLYGALSRSPCRASSKTLQAQGFEILERHDKSDCLCDCMRVLAWACAWAGMSVFMIVELLILSPHVCNTRQYRLCLACGGGVLRYPVTKWLLFLR